MEVTRERMATDRVNGREGFRASVFLLAFAAASVLDLVRDRQGRRLRRTSAKAATVHFGDRTRAATTDAHQMRTVVVGHRRGRRRGGGSSERAVATGRAPAGNWLPNIGDLSGSHGTGRGGIRVE